MYRNLPNFQEINDTKNGVLQKEFRPWFVVIIQIVLNKEFYIDFFDPRKLSDLRTRTLGFWFWLYAIT